MRVGLGRWVSSVRVAEEHRTFSGCMSRLRRLFFWMWGPGLAGWAKFFRAAGDGHRVEFFRNI
jgi:hypothetical protein